PRHLSRIRQDHRRFADRSVFQWTPAGVRSPVCHWRVTMKPLKTLSFLRIAGIALIASSVTSAAYAAESIVMSSTTSSEQSGLFSHLLPAFSEKSGIEVKVVAQGTGQALDTGRRGD